jgi:Cu/Ag efflux protein CusF
MRTPSVFRENRAAGRHHPDEWEDIPMRNPRTMLALALALAIASWPGSAAAEEPCCNVTALDAKTGMVTAKEKATGRTFQFKVANQAALKGLKVGQAIHADFTSMKVSLRADGAEPVGAVLNLQAPR